MKIKAGYYFFIFLVAFSGCQLFKPKPFKASAYIPPGGVKVGDHLFLDATEIANIHWAEFLHFTKDSMSKEEHQWLFPDTTVFSQIQPDSIFALDSNCVLKKMLRGTEIKKGEIGKLQNSPQYFSYPGFRYHPVVGISLDQAILYSIWRTSTVETKVNKKLSKQKQAVRLVLNFRVPTFLEYQGILQTHLVDNLPKKEYEAYCLPYRNLFPYEKHFNANLPIWIESNGKRIVNTPGPAFRPVFSHFNHWICNLVGNAAELTSDPGRSWGGSCFDSDRIKNLNGESNPIKPTYWLGFRNICEVSTVAADTYSPVSWRSNPMFIQVLERIKKEKVR